MLFLNLLCSCSLVCFVAIHQFMLLFISLLCCCSIVCFVVVHEFVFASVVVH